MKARKHRKSMRTKKIGSDYMSLIRKFPLTAIADEQELADASAVFSELTLKMSALTEGEDLYREALGQLIATYERRRPMPKVSPVLLIKDIMAVHGLKQVDLIPQFGSKSLISEFLSGKRTLTKEQIIKLCKRFSLNPAALIPELAEAS